MEFFQVLGLASLALALLNQTSNADGKKVAALEKRGTTIGAVSSTMLNCQWP
jgi:hypothetical protein